MRCSKPIALVLAWVACGPALAQERDLQAAVEQLEAENAVLRIELRALRQRLEAVEDVLAARAPAAQRPHPWPDAAEVGPDVAVTPAGGLSADGANLLLSEVRLADDAGAASCEELLNRLVVDLQAEGADLREVLGRWAAFDPARGNAFLVPASLWEGLALEGAPARPVFGDLLTTWRALAPALREGQVTGVQTQALRQRVAPGELAPSSVGGGFLGVACSDAGQVTEVVAGSAAVGRLEVGDRVRWIEVEGDRRELWQGDDTLVAALRPLRPGTELSLGVERGGASLEVQVRLGARPQADPEDAPEPEYELRPVEAVQRLEVSVSGALGVARLTLLVIRVQGRWLVASTRSTWFEQQARRTLEALYALSREGSWGELGPELAASLARRGAVGVEVLNASQLSLPMYRVELEQLANAEWGARAKPLAASYPTLLIGPLPGEHDPLKNPYRVRVQ